MYIFYTILRHALHDDNDNATTINWMGWGAAAAATKHNQFWALFGGRWRAFAVSFKQHETETSRSLQSGFEPVTRCRKLSPMVSKQKNWDINAFIYSRKKNLFLAGHEIYVGAGPRKRLSRPRFLLHVVPTSVGPAPPAPWAHAGVSKGIDEKIFNTNYFVTYSMWNKGFWRARLQPHVDWGFGTWAGLTPANTGGAELFQVSSFK